MFARIINSCNHIFVRLSISVFTSKNIKLYNFKNDKKTYWFMVIFIVIEFNRFLTFNFCDILTIQIVTEKNIILNKVLDNSRPNWAYYFTIIIYNNTGIIYIGKLVRDNSIDMELHLTYYVDFTQYKCILTIAQ